LDCEVDAYGDFLQVSTSSFFVSFTQPLGKNATSEYFNNTRTTGSVSDALQEKRRGLYEILYGQPIHVLPYIPSLFIHIGTSQEYLEHLCHTLPAFGFQKIVNSSISQSENAKEKSSSVQGCVLYSVLR
jgi:hypothetical protein